MAQVVHFTRDGGLRQTLRLAAQRHVAGRKGPKVRVSSIEMRQQISAIEKALATEAALRRVCKSVKWVFVKGQYR